MYNLLLRKIQRDVLEGEVGTDALLKRRVRGWLLQIGAQDSETLVYYSLYS